MDVSDDEMDKEELQIETPENGKKGFMYLGFRLTSALLVPTFAFLFLSILLGFLAVLMGHFSITTPLSLPFQCKILSSSVDLRSSKVCELGLLNYKAKHVFYPNNRSRFRCRYDYYWASVFEVEYKDYSLGQTQFASAEAPNEALPLNCRPNFGVAWLTKDRFKVNKTYDCWYTSGISKVSLYRDDLFSCLAKDPSQVEMIKRYFILSKQMLHSSSPAWKKGKRMFSRANLVFFKRACFLVAYFSFMGWLTIQYGKRLGLPEIYRVYNF
ncbi:hypothetical protein OIU84_004284 [Salix udensis]|uniref:Uncharacterized protein n=1 Tax=Salix udensis TaxID=889485 RepID=A0AAD6K1X3_9ROSI|nr:hypothetical protein OIU84_004284 [Salix udensis]